MITNGSELLDFLRRYHRTILEAEPAGPVTWPSFRVPEPLHGLYELFGQHIDEVWGPLTSQDHLLPVHKLQESDGEVTFLNENQGVWTCCYGVEPPHPVFRYDDEPKGVLQADTLEEFLITFALQEAVMSSPWLLAVHGGAAAEDLGIDLVDLHRQGRFACHGPTHDFWSAPDEDVLCMNTYGTGLWLASYSERVLDLRLPEYECQIISPGDPHAPVTFVGRSDREQSGTGGATTWRRFLGRIFGR